MEDDREKGAKTGGDRDRGRERKKRKCYVGLEYLGQGHWELESETGVSLMSC